MSLYEGLYGSDVPISEDKAADKTDDGDAKKTDASAAATWNPALQMLAPHLRRKRVADVAAKAAALRAKAKQRSTAPSAGSAGKTVVTKTVHVAKNDTTSDVPTLKPEPFMPMPAGAPEIVDEYVPSKPNDFDFWRAIFDKEVEERMAELRARKEETKEEQRRRLGAAIAPPPSLMGNVVSPAEARPPPSSTSSSIFGGGRADAGAWSAQKTEEDDDADADPFANMPVSGYGAKASGSQAAGSSASSAPTAAVNTAPAASAVLAMSGDDVYNARARLGKRTVADMAAAPAPRGERMLFGKAGSSHAPPSVGRTSRKVVLTNLVGPGEVDDDLEGETAEECSKFGKVVKTVVTEVRGVAPEEAVKVFVEFAAHESAAMAVATMNGRFFGGRVVRAEFAPD